MPITTYYICIWPSLGLPTFSLAPTHLTKPFLIRHFCSIGKFFVQMYQHLWTYIIKICLFEKKICSQFNIITLKFELFITKTWSDIDVTLTIMVISIDKIQIAHLKLYSRKSKPECYLSYCWWYRILCNDDSFEIGDTKTCTKPKILKLYKGHQNLCFGDACKPSIDCIWCTSFCRC